MKNRKKDFNDTGLEHVSNQGKDVFPLPAQRKYIDQMSKIWAMCWQGYKMHEYMVNPRTDEEKLFIQNHPFFNIIQHYLFRVAILEIAKLIKPSRQYEQPQDTLSNSECPNQRTWKNRNDKFTIDKFFNKIRGKVDVRDQECLWINIQEEHKDICKSIEFLRNKIYAHSDPETTYPSIPYPQLEGLLLDIKKLLLELRAKIGFTLRYEPIAKASLLEAKLENWNDFSVLLEAQKQRRKMS